MAPAVFECDASRSRRKIRLVYSEADVAAPGEHKKDGVRFREASYLSRRFERLVKDLVFEADIVIAMLLRE